MSPIDTARRGVAAAWATAALLTLGGCATIFSASKAPGDAPAIDPPRFEAPTQAEPPRVALVLSGGAVRAFAIWVCCGCSNARGCGPT